MALELLHCVFDIIIDIDECSSSPCEHTCTNTPGSFECSCNSGYELGLDGLSCDGITIIAVVANVVN